MGIIFILDYWNEYFTKLPNIYISNMYLIYFRNMYMYHFYFKKEKVRYLTLVHISI